MGKRKITSSPSMVWIEFLQSIHIHGNSCKTGSRRSQRLNNRNQLRLQHFTRSFSSKETRRRQFCGAGVDENALTTTESCSRNNSYRCKNACCMRACLMSIKSHQSVVRVQWWKLKMIFFRSLLPRIRLVHTISDSVCNRFSHVAHICVCVFGVV